MSEVLSRISVNQMTSQIKQMLAVLESQDLLPVVQLAHKKMQKAGVTPVLSEVEAVTALKQYYALPILEAPCQQFAISAVVDEYWHWHVLDTRAWRDFCNVTYGKMMHHVPLDPDNIQEFERVRALSKETREMLVLHFGDQVNEKAYPEIKADGKDVVICTVDYCVTSQLFD